MDSGKRRSKRLVETAQVAGTKRPHETIPDDAGDGDFAEDAPQQKSKRKRAVRRKVSENNDETYDAAVGLVQRGLRLVNRRPQEMLEIINEMCEHTTVNAAYNPSPSSQLEFRSEDKSEGRVRMVKAGGDARANRLNTEFNTLFADFPSNERKRYTMTRGKKGAPRMRNLPSGTIQYLFDDTSKKQAIEFTYTLVPSNEFDALTRGQVLENFFNNWDMHSQGMPIPGGYLTATMSNLIDAHLRHGPPHLVDVLVRTGGNNRPSIGSSIQYLDPIKLEGLTYTRSTMTPITLKSELPDQSSKGILCVHEGASNRSRTGDPVAKDKDGRYESRITSSFTDQYFKTNKSLSKKATPEEKAKALQGFRDREAFERFVKIEMWNRVTTEKDLVSAIDRLEVLYTSGIAKAGRQTEFMSDQAPALSEKPKSDPSRLVLFRNDLFSVLAKPGVGLVFRPRAPIQKALGLDEAGRDTMPQPILRTTDTALALRILHDARAEALSKQSGLAAYTYIGEAVVAANLQIASGISVRLDCDCDESESQTKAHPCCGCGRDCLCADLVKDDDGKPLCPRCMGKYNSANNEVQSRLISSIVRSIRAELKGQEHLVAEYGEVNKLCSDAEAWVKRQLQSTSSRGSYPDHYSKDKIRKHELTGHPYRGTVDAVNILDDLKHHVNRIAITSNAMNHAKYTHLAGHLQIVADGFRRLEKGQLSLQDKKELVASLLEQSFELTAIKMKHGHLKASRAAKTLPSEQEKQLRTAEQVSGKLCEADASTWREVAQRSTPARRFGGVGRLTDAQRDAVKRIMKQISDKFKGSMHFELQFSASDCAPYPNPWEEMPQDWDWDTLESWMSYKLRMMKYHCNRWWRMSCTGMSLLLEIYWQLCDPEYEDFLRLPCTLNVHSPFMVSVGKQEPGKAMQDGWPAEPSDISERDASQNNLCVETTFSNYLKYDYPKERYGLLKTLVRDLHVPTKFFDAQKERPAGPSLSDGVGEVDYEELAHTLDRTTTTNVGEYVEEGIAETSGDSGVTPGDGIQGETEQDLSTRYVTLQETVLAESASGNKKVVLTMGQAKEAVEKNEGAAFDAAEKEYNICIRRAINCNPASGQDLVSSHIPQSLAGGEQIVVQDLDDEDNESGAGISAAVKRDASHSSALPDSVAADGHDSGPSDIPSSPPHEHDGTGDNFPDDIDNRTVKMSLNLSQDEIQSIRNAEEGGKFKEIFKINGWQT